MTRISRYNYRDTVQNKIGKVKKENKSHNTAPLMDDSCKDIIYHSSLDLVQGSRKDINGFLVPGDRLGELDGPTT